MLGFTLISFALFLCHPYILKLCFVIVVLKHMYELWTTQEFKYVFPYGYVEVLQDVCNEGLVVMMCRINSLLHTFLFTLHALFPKLKLMQLNFGSVQRDLSWRKFQNLNN